MVSKNKFLNGIRVLTPDILNDRNLSFCERVYSWGTMSSLGVSSIFHYEYDMRFEYADTLRGLFFQDPPYHQSVLIRCITGSAVVVAVPMNPSSMYYKKYFKYTIDDKAREQIFIPEGCAIGFYSLESKTVLSIKADNNFIKNKMLRINPFDPTVGITWPQGETLYISALDKTAPDVDDAETFYTQKESMPQADEQFIEEAEQTEPIKCDEAEKDD